MFTTLSTSLATLLGLLFKLGAGLYVANEIRGFILAVPVLVGLWKSGGDLMAIYIAACSLGGIALSVVVPLVVARRLQKLVGTAST